MFTIVLLYAEKQNNKALSAKYCGTITSSSYAWKHQKVRCVPLPSAGRHHVGPGLAAGPPPTAPGSTKGEERAPAHGWKAPRGARAGSRKGLGHGHAVPCSWATASNGTHLLQPLLPCGICRRVCCYFMIRIITRARVTLLRLCSKPEIL